MSKLRKRKRHTARKILFGFEIFILLILVVGLFVYTQINKHLDNLNFQEFKDIEGNKEHVEINEGVSENDVLSGYMNIALFGMDKRSEDGAVYGNSDSLLVASINNDTKEVRLVSLLRDTYMRIGEDKEGEDWYSKCNAAYLVGGPKQAISMLNTNLDLDIDKYIAVDFSAMSAMIDAMGGLDVELSYEEIVHTNNHCKGTVEQTGNEYVAIEEPERPADIEKKIGTYHLNGDQVTSFCRIRQGRGMDMGRALRQRYVLGLISDKAKKMGINKLVGVADKVFPMIYTNFSKSELIKLGTGIFSYSMGESITFPEDYIIGSELTEPVTGLDCLIPATLETNVKYLHEFLFANEEYTPSEIIKERSRFVIEKTGFGNEYVPDERKYLIDEDDLEENLLSAGDETDSENLPDEDGMTPEGPADEKAGLEGRPITNEEEERTE